MHACRGCALVAALKFLRLPSNLLLRLPLAANLTGLEFSGTVDVTPLPNATPVPRVVRRPAPRAAQQSSP